MDCPIQANPDVAGIGVRFSIYFQAVFAILSTVVRFYMDGDTLDRDELIESTFKNSMVIIFTGLAIALSGVIQATTFGLTVYHAVLLLDLCWVIIIGALVPFFVILHDKKHGFRKANSLLRSWCGLRDLNNEHADAKYSSRLHLLHSLHFTITSCVGLWVSIRLRTFDISKTDCIPTASTIVVIFGRRQLVTSRIYHILSLLLYGTFLLPILNVAVAQIIFLLLPWGLTLPLEYFGERGQQEFTNHAVGPLSLSFLLGAIIFVIVSTEQTIRSNNVTSGEGLWTLGQTLALLAAFISTIDFDLWLWGNRKFLLNRKGLFFEFGLYVLRPSGAER